MKTRSGRICLLGIVATCMAFAFGPGEWPGRRTAQAQDRFARAPDGPRHPGEPGSREAASLERLADRRHARSPVSLLRRARLPAPEVRIPARDGPRAGNATALPGRTQGPDLVVPRPTPAAGGPTSSSTWPSRIRISPRSTGSRSIRSSSRIATSTSATSSRTTWTTARSSRDSR